MFGWIRKWRRRKWAKRPFPDHWKVYLEQHVPFYTTLPREMTEPFLARLKVFVWEKYFFPGKGLDEVTDEMKVVIAAAAIRLILYRDLSYYDRLTEIVVYPDAYRHPEGEGVILGEAHNWGVVVLSWSAVLHGLKNPYDGMDTATHEFAHVLDRRGGSFNGTPPLDEYANYRPWARVMSRHYLALRKNKRRQRKVLRSYGATNEVEFFAVATEAFFEKSLQMKKQTPDLYQELSDFYGCDPAAQKTTERTR